MKMYSNIIIIMDETRGQSVETQVYILIYICVLSVCLVVTDL